MKTIWKYEISFEPTPLTLPKGAIFRSAAVQGNSVMLWFELESDTPLKQVRTFHIYGTGHEITENMGESFKDYVATVHVPPFVWHVFEERSL